MDGAGIDAYKVLAVILNVLLGVAMVWLQFAVRELRDSVRERLAEQGKAIEKVRDDLNNFKAAVPHQYVMREDFVRAISVLDHKMDRFGEELSLLNKNVSRLLGGDGRAAAP